jgi:hypothetical protein
MLCEGRQVDAIDFLEVDLQILPHCSLTALIYWHRGDPDYPSKSRSCPEYTSASAMQVLMLIRWRLQFFANMSNCKAVS